jgi:hypothetical protein
MSVIEIELSIIWIDFRDSAILPASNPTLVIPIATNPTITAIATPESKPMPEKVAVNGSDSAPFRDSKTPTALASVRQPWD